MRRFFALFLCVAAISSASVAEVLESLKTRTGKEYFQVEILDKDAVGLKIRHDAGTARVPFDILPDDIQAKYKFSHREAQQQKAKESQAVGMPRKGQLQANRESVSDAPKMKWPSKVPPVAPLNTASDGKGPENRDVLESQISALRLRIQLVESDIEFLEKQSGLEKKKIRYVSGGANSMGRTVPDKAAQARARKYDKEISGRKANIVKAEFLIREKEFKYLQLTGRAL